MSAEVVIKT